MSVIEVSLVTKGPSAWDQVVDLADKEGAWLFGKSCSVIYTGLAWKKTINGSLSPTEANVGDAAKVAKCAIGATELPKKLVDLRNRIKEFFRSPTPLRFKNILIAGCAIGAPVTDMFDIAKKFSFMPKLLEKVWGATGPVLMFFGLGDMAVGKLKDLFLDVVTIVDFTPRQGKNIVAIKARDKIVNRAACRIVKTVADLAMAVSYVALSVILFTTFFGLVSVAGWAPLTLTTIALAATIFSKFYGKIVIDRLPEGARKPRSNSMIAATKRPAISVEG